MANVAHSSLTGADLHESKGTAAAAVDTIFVADGAGSGTFKKIPPGAISALANPFGAQLLHVREQVASGVALSNYSTTTWPTHTINTTVTNEVGAVRSTNQLTLLAGTYYVDLTKTGYYTNTGTGSAVFQLRLRNLTTAATLLAGQSLTAGYGLSGVSATTIIFLPVVIPLRGRFTLAATSVLEIQVWANGGTLTGPNVASGEVNVGLDAEIWKVA